MLISSLSQVYVKVPVEFQESGVVVDPTGDDVEIAFTTVGSDPVSDDWNTSEWETAGSIYKARCLVGPAGTITLTKDRAYNVWVRVTDSPETPVLRHPSLLEVF